MLRRLLLVGLVVACDGSPGVSPPADPIAPAAPADAPTAPPAAAPAPSADGTVTVKNPIGTELKGTVVKAPADGSAEHTLIAALGSQASDAGFDAFLAYIHPSAKSETLQVDQLRAYTWEHSRGAKAGKCLHDGGLIVVARKDVDAQVAGASGSGVRLSVWCGEDRMPVPFTLYPDGATWRFTQFGLN
jgi:hypothetical protein